MLRKKNGFTLIELIGVLVIFAIITLIVTPLVMNIIRKAKISARKRSVDTYGRSVELAIASYLLDNGYFPTDLHTLNIEYSGNEVVCNVMVMKENGGLYMSQCRVNNVDVKDSNTDDGWYHYNTRDLEDFEYVDEYGKAIEISLKDYYDTNNTYPDAIASLTIDYTGKKIKCDSTINPDGTVYLTKCSVNNNEVLDETSDDNYYHYGKLVRGTDVLLKKVNDVSITNYSDGDIHEMYTFNHEATEQTEALTDYRYIGNDPYNYVTFNDELWRIIGVFTVEDGTGNKEQRIKIMKNNSLGNYAYDSNWNNDYSTATINTYLNADYYNNLSDAARKMIAETKYYLGGEQFGLTGPYGNGSTIYNWERGVKVLNGHSVNWVGKIALMYPSDYAYTYALGISETCFAEMGQCKNSNGYENTWMPVISGWMLSPRSDWSKSIAFVYYYSLRSNTESGNISAIRPVLYLSSSVKLTSGDGSEDNPYQLSMN